MNAHDFAEQRLRYASGYHAPVLCNAVIKGLITRTDGTYVDGTLGGGGHTAAILDALTREGSVVAIDRDDDAIREASDRLSSDIDSGRLRILKGNFADMRILLGEAGIEKVDGILLDLGVSSHQLDEAERGFSHRMAGPLDMRMDRTMGEPADVLVNTLEASDLSRLLRRYGEEPRSGRIARAIIAARPIATTQDLADAIRNVAPVGQVSKTLSRVFQALRIEVNKEIDALEQALLATIDLLATGGRLAVISYHSLEDRPTKRFLRSGNLKGEIQKDFFGNKISPWLEITRKPVFASVEEVEMNPRSRSARLRLAERVESSGYSV